MSPREALAVVEAAHAHLFGEAMSRQDRRLTLKRLTGGEPLSTEILALVTSSRRTERVATRVEHGAAGLEPGSFVDHAYREILGREADPGGRAHTITLLDTGWSRHDVARALAGSDEHVNRLAAELYPLPDLRRRFPERFVEARCTDGSSITCFVADTPAELEWMASMIGKHDYYDRPGIWGMADNRDKQVMAAVIAGFGPTRVLDLGCSNGTIVRRLRMLGVDAEGIELSRSAVELAHPEVRPHLHVGDVTSIELDRRFDLIYGLDIFEHVPLEGLDAILAGIGRLLAPGGLIFANIPAFGPDPEFGTVFDLYVDDWAIDAAENRPFRRLHADEFGFPLHGHLIWAAAPFWVDRFRRHGFGRVAAIEREVHRRYDGYFERETPARKAFFVFARDRAAAERITLDPPAVDDGS